MSASPRGVEYTLSLADGIPLALRAVDAESTRVLSFLAKATMLERTPDRDSHGERHELVVTSDRQSVAVPPESLTGAKSTSICELGPWNHPLPREHQLEGACADADSWHATAPNVQQLTSEQWFWQQLVRLSACIGRETHARGGVLLHSGLAACPGSWSLASSGRTRPEYGVLLAGRSGVGKSTALRRLPSPWLALADDVTLLLRDEKGTYWAHPWPTWSRFFGEEASDGRDIWNVQRAVPLRAIFVLEQGEKD